MKDLKYQLNVMEDTINEYREMAEALRTISISTGAMKQELAEAWASDAGRKFVDSLDTSWIPAVNHYADVLDHMGELLKTSIDKYEQISDKADAVFIQ